MNCLITEKELYPKSILSLAPRHWKFFFLKRKTQGELIRIAKKRRFEIIFTSLGLSFNQDLIRLQPCLKLLVSPTTGLNHIDLAEAKGADIRVLSLSGKKNFLNSITSTAEHAWALILIGARNIRECFTRISRGSWDRENLNIIQLKNKTIGIIGFGRLGRKVARYANAFEMKILVNECKKKIIPKYCKKENLQNLCKKSHVIVLMANYSKGDPVVIKRTHFSLMQKGSLFINISRGELVDEKGLKSALKKKRLRYAGLDVLNGDSTWGKNQKIRNQIYQMAKESKKIFITPHIGGYAQEALNSTRSFLFKETVKYYRNVTQ